jgi:hypothetical protein
VEGVKIITFLAFFIMKKIHTHIALFSLALFNLIVVFTDEIKAYSKFPEYAFIFEEQKINNALKLKE